MISIENLEKYSDKNAGAFHVLELLSNHENQDLSGVIWETLVKNEIKGFRIWILFIISKFSLERMAELCLSIPGEILLEASGTIEGYQIINEYLDSNPNKTTSEFNLRQL